MPLAYTTIYSRAALRAWQDDLSQTNLRISENSTLINQLKNELSFVEHELELVKSKIRSTESELAVENMVAATDAIYHASHSHHHHHSHHYHDGVAHLINDVSREIRRNKLKMI